MRAWVVVAKQLGHLATPISKPVLALSDADDDIHRGVLHKLGVPKGRRGAAGRAERLFSDGEAGGGVHEAGRAALGAKGGGVGGEERVGGVAGGERGGGEGGETVVEDLENALKALDGVVLLTKLEPESVLGEELANMAAATSKWPQKWPQKTTYAHTYTHTNRKRTRQAH